MQPVQPTRDRGRPLLGLALTGIDFRLTCLVAALVFTVLAVFQSRTLPSGKHEAPSTGRVVAGVVEVAKNRRLVWFAITMISAYVLSFQTYLSLPMEARRLAGDGTAGALLVASLFLLTGLLTAFCQLRLTPWSRRRLGEARALTAGVLLLGLSFVPLTLPLESLPVPLRFVPLLATTALLATGTMMVFPLEMDAVVGLAGGRLVATHYGLYSTIVGVGILTGTLFTGALLGACWSAGLPSIPWLVLASLGILCALGVRRSARAMKGALQRQNA